VSKNLQWLVEAIFLQPLPREAAFPFVSGVFFNKNGTLDIKKASYIWQAA